MGEAGRRRPAGSGRAGARVGRVLAALAMALWGAFAAASSASAATATSAPSSPSSASAAPADANRPTVYLTFDDGPSPLTDRVLAILRQQKIAATFFVLGQQAERYPDELRAIVQAGHAVGNHTYNHNYKELYGTGFRSFADQITRTEQIIRRTAGVQTRLVRAPGGTYGNFDALYFGALRQAGYVVFDWNVDSGDSKRRGVPASEIVRGATDARLGGDLIVLLHDGPGHAETVKALPAIISFYRKHGYRFAPLSAATKPVTFRLADLLPWKRTDPPLATAVAWLGGPGAAAKEGGIPAAPKPDGAATAPVPEPGAVLPAADLAVIDGEPFVPLRLWAAASGGSVHWDGGRKTAVAALPGCTVVADAKRQTLEAADAQGGSRRLATKAVIRGGTLLLPLADLQRLPFGPEAARSAARADAGGGSRLP